MLSMMRSVAYRVLRKMDRTTYRNSDGTRDA
jgi:hypothetical protein